MNRKFSLIKEQHDHTYTWRCEVVLEGIVTAGSEGDAGYIADEIVQAIEGYVTHKVLDIQHGDHLGEYRSEEDSEDSDNIEE
jgi:hypothetical protein